MKFSLSGIIGDSATSELAEIVGNIPPDIILFFVVLGILYIAAFRGIPQLLRISKYGVRLLKEAEVIQRTKTVHFNRLRQSLPELAYLLDEYKELTKGKYNAENCEVILSEESIFRELDVDEAALQHYPGIFTAFGIAGTFFGILFTLIPLESSSMEEVNLIENLLRGAGVAFLTSIIGIIASLMFLTYERRVIGHFRSHLHDFQMAINQAFTRLTSEGLLLSIHNKIDDSNISNELKEIKNALETMADDIGAAVSKEIAQTIETLSSAMESSIHAVGSSSDEIVSRVMSSIDDTLNKFSDKIQKLDESSGQQADLLMHFDKSVNNAKDLADKLEQLLPSLINVSSDIRKSSENFERLPEVLGQLMTSQTELTAVVKESVALMNESWKDERQRLMQLAVDLKDVYKQFEEGIVLGLETTMSKFDDELSRAGTYVVTWLDRMHEDVKDFESKVALFNDVLQGGASSIQEQLTGLTQVLTNHSQQISQYSSEIAESLNTRLQELKEEIGRIPSELQQSVNQMSDVYKRVTDQLPSDYQIHIEQALAPLNQNIQDMNEQTAEISRVTQKSIANITKIYEHAAKTLPQVLETNMQQLVKGIQEAQKGGLRKRLFG